eukprot:2519975-Ditylum_brightwellii.AAC.1
MKNNCTIEPACAAASVPEEGDGNNVNGDNNADGAIGTNEISQSRRERGKLMNSKDKSRKKRYQHH